MRVEQNLSNSPELFIPTLIVFPIDPGASRASASAGFDAWSLSTTHLIQSSTSEPPPAVRMAEMFL